MIFSALSRILGGVWALRLAYRTCKSGTAKRVISAIYTRALQERGTWISMDAHFDSVPCFPHGLYGIFISGGVSIGTNCVIFQHVTIGSNTLIDSAGFGAPLIGENCYIGAGAKIIGNVRLGRDVRVGANAVVVRDVPDNTIVTIGDQRMVTRNRPLDNRFFHRYKGHWRYFDNGTWHHVSDTNELEILNSRLPPRA